MEADAPLSAWDVGKHYDVRVWNAENIGGLSEADKRQLFVIDRESWWAFTINYFGKNLIVVHPCQTKERMNSVIMHEMSHIILGHELHAGALSADGHLIPTNFDATQEAEADWLGGTLLLPRPALLRIRSEGMSDRDASLHYCVSDQMLRWRIRMTGVDYQIANRARRR